MLSAVVNHLEVHMHHHSTGKNYRRGIGRGKSIPHKILILSKSKIIGREKDKYDNL